MQKMLKDHEAVKFPEVLITHLARNESVVKMWTDWPASQPMQMQQGCSKYALGDGGDMMCLVLLQV